MRPVRVQQLAALFTPVRCLPFQAPTATGLLAAGTHAWHSLRRAERVRCAVFAPLLVLTQRLPSLAKCRSYCSTEALCTEHQCSSSLSPSMQGSGLRGGLPEAREAGAGRVAGRRAAFTAVGLRRRRWQRRSGMCAALRRYECNGAQFASYVHGGHEPCIVRMQSYPEFCRALYDAAPADFNAAVSDFTAAHGKVRTSRSPRLRSSSSPRVDAHGVRR